MGNKAVLVIKQIILSVFAGIVLAFPISKLNSTFLPDNAFKNGTLILAVIVFCLATVLPFVVGYRVKDASKDIAIVDTCHQILIFGIALNLFKWSFLKFFNLHLTTSLVVLDMPLSMVSGRAQMSHFFGQSQLLKTSLGIVESLTAVLVLYKITRLMGAGLVLVIMTNIILLDIVYSVSGPVSEAALILIAALYLVWLERERLFNITSTSVSIGGVNPFERVNIPFIAKAVAILIPFMFLAPQAQQKTRTGITGKYKIQSDLTAIPLFKDASTGSSIAYLYFDFGDKLVLTSKDYTRQLTGTLTFSKETNNFTCTWDGNHKNISSFEGEFIKSGLDYQSLLLIKGERSDYEIGLKRVAVKGLNRIY